MLSATTTAGPETKVPARAPWEGWRLAGIQINGPKARPSWGRDGGGEAGFGLPKTIWPATVAAGNSSFSCPIYAPLLVLPLCSPSNQRQLPNHKFHQLKKRLLGEPFVHAKLERTDQRHEDRTGDQDSRKHVPWN